MPPSVNISSDLSPDSLLYCVLEVDSAWKAANLGGGGASWEEIYTTAQFEAAAGVTDAQFIRILCPSSSIIDILAAATSGGVANPWHIRSYNGGETFNAYKVDDTALSSRGYTVTNAPIQVKTIDGGGAAMFDLTIVRPTDANTYSPYGLATNLTGDGWGQLDTDATTIQLDGESTNMGGLRAAANALLPNGKYNEDALAMFDDYFGSGNWSHMAGTGHNMPKESARTHIKFGWGSHGTPGNTATGEAWVFWNIPELLTPKAMGVAPTNLNWIYVGLANKIRASETGGVTWFDFYNLGAHDICVDPQNPGVVYYWSTGGNLNLLKKETLGAAGIQVSTAMMTETPLDVPTRIARDPSSGILLALPNGTVLKRRMNGSNSNLKTGLYNARGLHAYTGQKIIFVDAAEVWKSDNIQATTPTITAVTGNWTEYVDGINAHRMAGS